MARRIGTVVELKIVLTSTTLVVRVPFTTTMSDGRIGRVFIWILVKIDAHSLAKRIAAAIAIEDKHIRNLRIRAAVFSEVKWIERGGRFDRVDLGHNRGISSSHVTAAAGKYIEARHRRDGRSNPNPEESDGHDCFDYGKAARRLTVFMENHGKIGSNRGANQRWARA